jgi:Sec-independent protein translocase protein TatA
MERIQSAMRNSAESIGDVKKLLADVRAMLNAQLSETINAS